MMPAITRFPTLILSVTVAALPGCTTSFWYTAVQGAAYERCESIQDAAERSRCKSANYPRRREVRERSGADSDSMILQSLVQSNASRRPH
jgi:hypothetical protein